MRFRLFAVAWSVCLLFDLSNRGMTADPSQAVAVLAALIALVVPSTPLLLAIAAVAHAARTAVSLSDPSSFFFVHWYVDLAVNGAIVVSYASAAVRGRSVAVSEAAMDAALGPSARVLGPLVMFAAGTAKLNTTFLDPDQSCASAFYLCQRQAIGFGWLPDARWARAVAIGLTLCAEVLAPLALWSRRARPVAGLVAGTLVALLAINPLGHLYEFACPVFALFVWFGSPARADAAAAAAVRAVGGRGRALRWGFAACAVAWVGWMVWLGDGPDGAWARAASCRVVALVGIATVWAVALVPGRQPAEHRFALVGGGARLAWLFPALVGANELATYVGFPHNLTLSMASDLRAMPGRTNHVLLGLIGTPRLPGNAPVKVVMSSNPFLSAVRREDAAVNWLSVRGALAYLPTSTATVSIDGGPPTRFGPASTDPRVAPLPLTTWLVFSEPPKEQRCHHWLRVADPIAAPTLHGDRDGRARQPAYVASGP